MSSEKSPVSKSDKVPPKPNKIKKFVAHTTLSGIALLSPLGIAHHQNPPNEPPRAPIHSGLNENHAKAYDQLVSTSGSPLLDGGPITEPTPTPTPTETSGPEYTYVYGSGLIKIAVDKEGIPVNYAAPDGTIVNLDTTEMKRLKEAAIADHEPQVVTMIPLEDYKKNEKVIYSPPNYSPEHPKVAELPADVLTDEQLAERGINIIQSPKIDFHIRLGAFKKGGPFEDLMTENKNVTIVLVDGPRVAENYMQDPRYANLLNYVPQIKGDVSGYRAELLANYKSGLEYLRKVAQKPENYEHLLLDAKIGIHNYQTMTDEEIIKLMPSTGYVSGRYVYNYDYDRNSNFKPTNDTPRRKSFIFIAVGKTGISPENTVLYFDSNGNFDTKQKNFINLPDATPQARYTHPNPADLRRNPNVNAEDPYLYDNPDVGFIAEHEEVHRELIEGNESKGLPSNYSETEADYRAGNRIAAHWERWVKSGFTDNSGYYFVFSLPEEQGGGYILVGKENAQRKPAI